MNSRKFYGFIALVVLTITSILIILNLDIVLRAFHSYQSGSLTMEKFRLDLAAFDLGQSIPAIPANSKSSPLDGMIQVFVPAGEFIMGRGPEGASLRHVVYLDAYWMDRVEVTNTMYKLCVTTKGCSSPVDDNI
jgi:formylglycine-generating enzyme required for sulfatase activity